MGKFKAKAAEAGLDAARGERKASILSALKKSDEGSGLATRLAESMPGKMLKSGAEKVMDYASRPNAMIRGGAAALLAGKNAYEGAKKGLTEGKAPEGYEIAEMVGKKFGIENPMVLGALATAADVVDVPNPFGGASKAAKGAKALGMLEKGASKLKILEKLGATEGKFAHLLPSAANKVADMAAAIKAGETVPIKAAKFTDRQLKLIEKLREQGAKIPTVLSTPKYK